MPTTAAPSCYIKKNTSKLEIQLKKTVSFQIICICTTIIHVESAIEYKITKGFKICTMPAMFCREWMLTVPFITQW